jgi:ABC-type phosphate transport system substrate-binding protein
VKFSLKRIGATGILLGVVAGPVAVLAAPQAGAIPPVAHPKQDLESAGSDTIYWVTKAIDTQYNTNGNAINSDKDHAGPIPPVNIAPFPTSYTTVGDAHCAKQTFNSSSAATTPPNGSSAGIGALVADAGKGCIDYARSSRGTKAGDPANIDFWAFGLDALGVGRFQGAGNPKASNVPANLTQQQIIQIYTCNPATGAPYISDWHQVNAAAPKGSLIKKFSPQTSSGSYSFFNSQILNGTTVDAGCNSSHLTTFIEEHDAAEIPTAAKPNAIFPMSYAQWVADRNKKTPDLRNGIVEMSINGIAPSAKTINTVDGAGHFIGTRYVYNVTMPTQPDYTDVLRLVGADNSGAGFICSGAEKSIITAFGFQPLAAATTGTTSSGTNVTLKSACRVNPTPV